MGLRGGSGHGPSTTIVGMSAVPLYARSILVILALVHSVTASVEFSASSITVPENAGQVVLKLERTGATPAVDVAVTVAPGTASSWEGK